MTHLTKEDFLSYDDMGIKEVKLNIPGIKGKFYVRAVTADEKDRLEQEIERNPRHVRAKYVALSVCDKDGNRIFDDADVINLSKKSLKLIQPLFHAVIEANSITQEEIEEMAKNS